jgi:uncharacterized protein YqjF (DUF2071 family)
VDLETFAGRAWVGLVLFWLRVRCPGGPSVPLVGSFPEINVRTYVRGPDGMSGIWFFSLDAPHRLAPGVARALYHLPYRRAAIVMSSTAAQRRYASRRLDRHGCAATCFAIVSPGVAVDPEAVSALEHFLTARWRLFAPGRRGIECARVQHPPWVLRRSEAREVDTGLLRAAGLPEPGAGPLVHACDDVRASLTPLRRCPDHRSWRL